MTLFYRNIQIAYSDIGKGSAIVLLHGFLENSTMWQKITPILSKKNRVITIDLLGHGETGNLSYVHTMEDQAKMIKYVLDTLKLRKYILVGHSLGGYIALSFAELYPKNIKKLALVNSTALPDSLEKQKNRDRAIAMVKRNKEAFIKMAIPNLFTLESRQKYKMAIEFIKKEALKTSTQGVLASLEGMKIRKDLSKVLQTPYEKLLIIGKQDPLLSYDVLLSQEKKNTKIVEFSNGHMSHIENLEELILELTNLL